MEHSRPAVVLLSGGLDSTTVLAMAKAAGFAPHCMTFAYGQKQAVELEAAARVARAHGAAAHQVVRIDLGAFGGSALTVEGLQVPKDRDPEAMGGGIPITYVPARNTVFLSYALAWAEVLGAFDLFVGVNDVDYSGYPDCRPEFVRAFQDLANLATAAAVQGHGRYTIHAPLQRLNKAQIVQSGMQLGVDYSDTHSCYDPVGSLACGRCDACQLRHQGFVAAGVPDPTRYAPGIRPTPNTRQARNP